MKKKSKQINNLELSRYGDFLSPDIKNIVKRLGYKLIDVSFVFENQNNYLRIKIKHFDHPISLNDCEYVSKEIEKELDLRDPIPFSYILEVESPGTYEKFISEGISISDMPEHQMSEKYEFVLSGVDLIVKS